MEDAKIKDKNGDFYSGLYFYIGKLRMIKNTTTPIKDKVKNEYN